MIDSSLKLHSLILLLIINVLCCGADKVNSTEKSEILQKSTILQNEQNDLTPVKIDGKVNFEGVGRQLVEQGRTLVHNAMKRFMIILPAIFFKLGIAFTLLILITLVAVNNGFIGFLLLVVGVSSVLARLQESRRPNVVPIINPLPPYPAHHHVWDRSDTVSSREQDSSKLSYDGYTSYNGYNPQSNLVASLNSAYYNKYAVSG